MTASLSGPGVAVSLFGVLVMIGLYLLPSVVAMVRKVVNVGSVVTVNVFLGWTLVGWVVAMAMATRTNPPVPPPPVYYPPPTPPAVYHTRAVGHWRAQ
jgi:hypothetical protein